MKISIVAALLVLGITGSASALAQGAMAPPASGAAPMAKFKDVCGADMQRLCATAQTRKDQHKCIKQNMAQLSPGCSSFLAEKRAQHQQMKQQGATGAAPAGGAE